MNKLISAIKKYKTIGIFPHVSIDGDALGSSLALVIALKKMGKDVSIFIEEDIHNVYSFLPGKEYIKFYGKEDVELELAIALDSADLKRLGERQNIFRKAQNTISIDHHYVSTSFADYNYIDSHAAATGEIVYQLLNILGIRIDKEMATCLYVAIATDTGGGRYSNTTGITHQIISDLVNVDINVAELSQKIFDMFTLGKIRVIGYVLSNIRLYKDKRIVVGSIDLKTLQNLNAKQEDTDGAIDLIRKLENCEVAAFIKQSNDKQVKVSLRSNKDVDVSAIAQVFQGGGHKKAAGFTFDGSIERVEKDLVDTITGVL